MPDEQHIAGPKTAEASSTAAMPTAHENGFRSPSRPEPSQLRIWRETSTDFVNACGIIALATLETADVVGRAAGRIAHQAAHDGSHAAFEITHEVSRATHDILVDTTEIAVDTLHDVGKQWVRGAHLMSRQGRELAGIVTDLGRGLLGVAVSLMHQRDGRETPTHIAAVPIIVN